MFDLLVMPFSGSGTKDPIPDVAKLCPEGGLPMRTISTLAILAVGVVWSTVGCSQHDLMAMHAPAHANVAMPEAAAPGPQGQTLNLQGDQSAWINNDHMRGFYALSKEALGKGAPPLDAESYREKSYQIFRAFGKSMGADPDLMVDHLKDIPRQMVTIVGDDPKVLDSYDNFVVALMGPQ
jgi:hypothetical protein